MLKSIIDYVKYHYQFCENIESFFLTNNLDTNECYIKSCLVYKYLFEYYFKRNISLYEIIPFEYYFKRNISLYEIMAVIDNTEFLFMMNSPVLKNHLIFHHAFKTFWKRHKKGRSEIYIFFNKIINSRICVWSCILVFSQRSSVTNIIQKLYYIIEKIDKFYTNYHKPSMFYQKV